MEWLVGGLGEEGRGRCTVRIDLVLGKGRDSLMLIIEPEGWRGRKIG